jgi:hypothetical protein
MVSAPSSSGDGQLAALLDVGLPILPLRPAGLPDQQKRVLLLNAPGLLEQARLAQPSPHVGGPARIQGTGTQRRRFLDGLDTRFRSGRFRDNPAVNTS